MQYVLSNIQIPIMELDAHNELAVLKSKASRILDLSVTEITDMKILRESLDCRRKTSIQVVYTLLVSLAGIVRESQNIKRYEPKIESVERRATSPVTPVVVGAGPCGLFCAWTLAEMGYRPVVVERGEPVEMRSRSVDNFWKHSVLNPESNVQFGEGGAGAFSDGKLTTRINDARCDRVLALLHACGAPEETVYKAKAHIGTDVLRQVVVNLREKLKDKGVQFLFNTRLEELVVRDGALKGVRLSNNQSIDTEVVVLAIGHSARDTFQTLLEQGMEIAPKPFSVGVRIEHHQETINVAQYGSTRHYKLDAADYQVFEHLGERTAYTFCMCPGGVVVAAASEEQSIVTNGMSYHKRNGKNANAAYVVSVTPDDFGNGHPLAGISFQRELEKKCYRHTGSYAAPCQKLSDFLKGSPSQHAGSIKPSYTGEVFFTDLNDLLPGFVADGIKKSVGAFDRKIKGFLDNDALLTAMETRTSSPVRLVRNSNMQSTHIRGVYPAGEGAGYAGGIVSAAVDGIKAAESIAMEGF